MQQGLVKEVASVNENRDVENESKIFTRRVKRNSDEDETLETATARGNYKYWLSAEDIADIVRIHYNNYKRIGIGSEFGVIGSLSELRARIEAYQ